MSSNKRGVDKIEKPRIPSRIKINIITFNYHLLTDLNFRKSHPKLKFANLKDISKKIQNVECHKIFLYNLKLSPGRPDKTLDLAWTVSGTAIKSLNKLKLKQI